MTWRYCFTGHDLRYKDDGHFGYYCARCAGTCTNAFTAYGKELCLCGDTPAEHLMKRGYEPEQLVAMGLHVSWFSRYHETERIVKYQGMNIVRLGG